MIKFRGDHEGTPLVGLGLSEENMNRLKQGMPILIKTDEMEKLLGVKAEIFIFYGQTEESMTADLQKAGILPKVS